MEHIERRGKYPGCKAHFNAEECQAFLTWYTRYKAEKKTGLSLELSKQAIAFSKDIAKAIKGLLEEFPDMLEERTPEQVAEALAKDAAKIEKQQAAMAQGADNWKKVK